MLLAKLLLLVHGLVTIAYGIGLLANPAGIAEYMGLAIVSNDGTAELVTMYVGMSGAMSLFMLYAIFSRKWLNTATLFLALSMTGIMVGRALSFIIFDAGSYTLHALLYDIPVTILAWVAYYRLIHAPMKHE